MAKNKILDTIHETMAGAHKAGVVDDLTMREFDALCLPPIVEYSPAAIQKIRKRNKASQAVMANYMNMSSSAIQQWERGDRKPKGSSLKLLNLIDRKGLAALA
ncbi:MAG: helix-turn-helix domain-containing protein [Proteobacteria bacterium]|nr:helix-turn-helix domain-containing protein [Pseudomonadota bacterium]